MAEIGVATVFDINISTLTIGHKINHKTIVLLFIRNYLNYQRNETIYVINI